MQQLTPERRSVLTIAGSDSGGGAGVQADLRTIFAHGLHPLTAITALTAQNTRGVTAVHTGPPAILRAQIEACFDDFDVAAVKIGMLASADVVDCVADALGGRVGVPVVLDPVMVASSGAVLLEPSAMARIIDRLFPLATLVTPNLPEAELLAGQAYDARSPLALASTLRALGARAVLLKGGHSEGERVIDRLCAEPYAEFEHPRLPHEGHGTGCTLASAVAAQLALGQPLAGACAAACAYVHGALRHAYRPGRSALAVLAHDWRLRPP